MAGNWRAAGGALVGRAGQLWLRFRTDCLEKKGLAQMCTARVDLIGEPEVGCRPSTVGYATDCASFIIVALPQ
ncbi:hypothetical protein BamMEX5DRAFT_2603 [Burkholderia ambifaria MEX-5]|uniref:Uncharacterized protein n=2 Tax=Burkholderia ambifaria TaxID=152480 RepID=B1T487_9BURK|nr:hypothetical protein BamMEX5DRAFT_2603 [Burkholderia ambifaria MEX-5]